MDKRSRKNVARGKSSRCLGQRLHLFSCTRTVTGTSAGLWKADSGVCTWQLEEWPDPKEWSLQDTDAFVLVYDICSPDSFDYVKALRQRIAENSRKGPACICTQGEEATESPALRLSYPSGLQAGRRARGPHPRGRQQAGPSATALRTSSCTGHSSTQGLALRLPRVLSQIQLARAASLPRAPALCSSAHTSCASGPTTAGGAASSALQPHVTGLDREIS
ncbi:ras-like protein family member 10A isoform X2 [Arvicola amphibius]|uniref:ras-like protein family member 10A isoform X2 n=1 Tax=Arvicola amphibius TaxID=1047088 RepID=UPI0018E34573|nr:ras-like protein family member 10A isoform X2 [Arvicola amphibius]